MNWACACLHSLWFQFFASVTLLHLNRARSCVLVGFRKAGSSCWLISREWDTVYGTGADSTDVVFAMNSEIVLWMPPLYPWVAFLGWHLFIFTEGIIDCFGSVGLAKLTQKVFLDMVPGVSLCWVLGMSLLPLSAIDFQICFRGC